MRDSERVDDDGDEGAAKFDGKETEVKVKTLELRAADLNEKEGRKHTKRPSQ